MINAPETIREPAQRENEDQGAQKITCQFVYLHQEPETEESHGVDHSLPETLARYALMHIGAANRLADRNGFEVDLNSEFSLQLGSADHRKIINSKEKVVGTVSNHGSITLNASEFPGLAALLPSQA